MKETIEIDGYTAEVLFDPETGLFRGEFFGLNGGADFYSDSAQDLVAEGRISLRVFLCMRIEKGVAPLASDSA